MQWKTFGQLPNLRHEATISTREVDRIQVELSDIWYRFLEAIIIAYPLSDWEAIECTLWPNSGRLIMYPYKEEERFQRNERVSVQVHIEALEEQYWELLDALETEDTSAMEEYNVKTDTLVEQYWRFIVDAAHETPAIQLFQQLRKERTVYVYGCEEHPSAEDMTLLPI